MVKRVPDLEEREVLIEDIGPIEHMQFNAAPGTITVLRGANGAGKSQALNAIDALVNGKGRLNGRDGTTGGTARGFGVKISVGRGGANRRSGELVVESIEDRLNIADLVDPGLKDPHAADGRRIRALVQLSGETPRLELFASLVDGGVAKLRTLVSEEGADAPDLVAMAGHVKRALERVARQKEDEASGFNREAEAKLATTKDIDVTRPSDRKLLHEQLEAAIQRQATLVEQQKAGVAAWEKRQADLARLDAAKSTRVGITVEQAEQDEQHATNAVRLAHDTCDRLRRQLADAEREHRSAETTLANKRDILAVVRRETATFEALQKSVLQELPPIPTPDELNAAALNVQDARAANDHGVRVRDALFSVATADSLKAKAKDAAAIAETFRDAAKGTEDVLSRIVAKMAGPFKVDRELRLVVTGTERGDEFYAELSDGERWKLGLDVAIEAFHRASRPGLLVIPQEGWEGMDGRNRKLIAEHIRGTDLSIITAEADTSSDPQANIAAKTYGEVLA